MSAAVPDPGQVISGLPVVVTNEPRGAHPVSVIFNQDFTVSANGQTADIPVGDLIELAVDFNIEALTGGTSPTVQFNYLRKAADGNYYNIGNSGAKTAPGAVTLDWGAGLNGHSFGDTIAFSWTITGAPTSVQFHISIKGK